MYKTVLLISPFYPPNIGGVETSLFTLVKLLRRRGIKIGVCSYRRINTNVFNSLENYPFLQALHLFPGLFFKALWIMLWTKDTIGCLHGAGLTGGMIARILSKLFKVPYIVSTHTLYNRRLSNIEYNVFKKAKKVLCLSEASEAELRTGNTVVYRTLIDWELFKPNDTDYKRWKCLFVSRPIEKKGWKVVNRLSNLFIIKTILDTPNNELPNYYNKSEITITASQYPECFSRVILESLFCDTPVIASNKDIARFTIPEKIVQFVEPTVNSLTKAIKNFKRKPKGYYRRYAMREFGEKNLEIFINAYKDCNLQ